MLGDVPQRDGSASTSVRSRISTGHQVADPSPEKATDPVPSR
jgi:hypothetical protein